MSLTTGILSEEKLTATKTALIAGPIDLGITNARERKEGAEIWVTRNPNRKERP
jgi:hypothetical protein